MANFQPTSPTSRGESLATFWHLFVFILEICPLLSRLFPFFISFIFGSFAKDEATIYSDIDIFIKTTNEFRKKHLGFAGFGFLEDLRQDIARHFDKEVDLCNIAGFNDERKAKFLKGTIYV